jgi:hypothetical protein
MEDKFLTKKEVLAIFGVSATNPKRKKIYSMLQAYHNPANAFAIYKKSEVLEAFSKIQKQS